LESDWDIGVFARNKMPQIKLQDWVSLLIFGQLASFLKKRR